MENEVLLLACMHVAMCVCICTCGVHGGRTRVESGDVWICGVRVPESGLVSECATGHHYLVHHATGRPLPGPIVPKIGCTCIVHEGR